LKPEDLEKPDQPLFQPVSLRQNQYKDDKFLDSF